MTKRENEDQAKKEKKMVVNEKKKGQIPRDNFQQLVAFVQKKIATLF